MKAFKTIYTVALVLITIVVCNIGIYNNVYKKLDFSFLKHFNGFQISFGDDAVELTTEEVDVDEFTSIAIDVDYAKIEIIEGNAYHVEYAFTEDMQPSVEVKNNKLSVKAKANKVNTNFKFAKCELHITVPAGTELEEIQINVNAGDITLEKLALENLTIDGDAGNVELYELSADAITVRTDAGNIELHQVTAASFEGRADAGNVEVKDSEITTLEMTADAGAVTVKDSKLDTLHAKADLGSIYISGDFEKIEAECSMGAIEVKSQGSISGKKLDLTTSLGKVTVNGEDKGNSYRQ